jgi:hypothetical protein
VHDITHLKQIPFLPIEIFKSEKIISGDLQVQKVFRSSGTTGSVNAEHHVCDLNIYRESLRRGFNRMYGSASDYVFLALLPTYLEREDASLVYMVQTLMEQSGHAQHGFFLHDYDALKNRINLLLNSQQRFMLIGVTFALLELAEHHQLNLGANPVVETGGMKGRRKEIIREELHDILKHRFNTTTVHSEYGMTELLSQAWSKGEGRYHAPPWMRVETMDVNDPFQPVAIGQTGVIRVLDLANVHSCSFIMTQDLGRIYADGSFEVLGRLDQSDIRGCNLMVS